jgi:hypothetical protein
MTSQDTEVEVEGADEEVNTPFIIPVVKAKATLEIMTGKLPEHVYREALTLGLKQILNRGQTKLTKEAYPDPAQLKAAALEKAQETLEAMYAGKIRVVGGKSAGDKVPGVVMTEARRIARTLVKEEMKRTGIKVSHVEAKDITKLANALIAQEPWIVEQATEEVNKRGSKKVKIDVSSIPISRKKVEALEAKKAAKVVSATQAGMIANRGRGRPPVQPTR